MADRVDLNALYDLSDRVALVTGGAEGMGREVCRFLAAAGACVAVADINVPVAKDSAGEIVGSGVQDRGFLAETSLELWDKVHHINLRGPFLTIREAAKVMCADGNGGRIVNISSIGSVHPIFEGLVAPASEWITGQTLVVDGGDLNS